MARSLWSGSISFGLVNIPIRLYPAVSKKGVSFHQIDSKTGARVKMQRVSSKDGSEVPYEQIVKGYELSKDQYVLIEPEELDALDPESTRSIEIEEFIDLEDIDPVFFDTPYLVAPVKAAEKPYALLAKAMEEQGKVGIARFVMRTKQYLAAIRPADGRLMLSTMVYADELVDPKEISELGAVDDVEVSERELTMARQLIESLSTAFEPERFQDTYREQVLQLIERKASGATEVVEVAPAASEEQVVDLMAALEASVAAAKEARKRHPAGRPEAGEAAEEAEAAAKKPAKPAKPARKRKTA
jgi:DNA end-binding protein Ku